MSVFALRSRTGRLTDAVLWAELLDPDEMPDLDLVKKQYGKRFDESEHPRDPQGQFTDVTGGTEEDYPSDRDFLQSPSDAVESIANDQPATIAREDVRGVLERAATREDHPDLTNLTIEGTTIFSGGLNFRREDMPQIPKEHLKGFLAAMNAQGVDVKRESVSPLVLRPTQNQINAAQVGKLMGEYDKGRKDLRPILVAKDQYILDGHHRWALMAALDVETPSAHIKQPVIRLMVNHEKALDLMLDYDEAHGIAHQAHGQKVADRPWYRRKFDESQHPRDEQGRFAEGLLGAASHKLVVDRLNDVVGGSVEVGRDENSVAAAEVLADVLEEMTAKGYAMPSAGVAVGQSSDTNPPPTPSGATTWFRTESTTAFGRPAGPMVSILTINTPKELPAGADLDAACRIGFGGKMDDGTDRFTARTMRDVVVHEMGHIQAGHRTGAISQDDAERIYGSRDEHVTAEKMFRAAASVSAYAATNPNEFMAEAFTRLYRGEHLSPEAETLYTAMHGPKVKS